VQRSCRQEVSKTVGSIQEQILRELKKKKVLIFFNSPLSSVTATQSNPLGNWEQFNFVPNVSFSFPIAKIAKLFSLLLQCARVTVFASE